MKTALFVLLLLTTSCSKERSTINSVASLDTESGSELQAEENLLNEARLVALNKGNNEKLVKSFNTYLAATASETYTLESALNLRSQLIGIFNNRINLYITLLNESISGSRNAISLTINENPESSLLALQTLYNSLGTKKNRTKLSLAEQYLVFDLTLALKDKYSVQSSESIPTKAIMTFLKDQVAFNSKTPQDAFLAYSVAGKLLESSDDLYTIFFPIISKIKINKNSTLSEIELFNRISIYIVKNNFSDFISSEDEVAMFFTNMSFISSNKIEKIENLRRSQQEGFFEVIDNTFSAHNAFLGKVASEQSLDSEVLIQIQDHFIKSTHLDLLKSLNTNKQIYTDIFKESCLNFRSKELELILTSYILAIDKKQEIPCLRFLREKIKTNDFEYVKSLSLQMDKELASLDIIENPDFKKYFTSYNHSNLSSLILNIVAKFSNNNKISNPIEQKNRHAYLYDLYNNSKLATMSALEYRSEIQLKNIHDFANNDKTEIYIPAGVYKGDVNIAKPLYLHPLAVIVPGDSDFTLKVVSMTGGRIEGNFRVEKYDVVVNKADNLNTFKGAVPIQQNVVETKPKARGKCNKECHEHPVESSTFSRSVTAGVTPADSFEGGAGIKGPDIEFHSMIRSVLETPIYSFGLQGYRGNQGLSAPQCNSSDEYQVFYGHQYSKLEKANGDRSEFVSLAGKSGKGGTGGSGGKIIISSEAQSGMYPALSLGGLGGFSGDAASCTYPGQVDGLIGSPGEFGSNGLVEVKL